MVPTLQFDASELSLIVDLRHVTSQLDGPNDFIAQPHDVSRRAEEFARYLYTHQDAGISGSDIVSAAWAGYALYTLDRYGLHYNSLARLTTKTIADVVAEISADPRLSIPQQRQDQLARLSNASLLAQIVRFSEIAVIADNLEQLSQAGDLAGCWLRENSGWGGQNHYELENWCQYAYTAIQHCKRNLFSRQPVLPQEAQILAGLKKLHDRCRVRKIPKIKRMGLPRSNFTI